jgi:anti-sigma factor ChrR (cupin superfamily)
LEVTIMGWGKPSPLEQLAEAAEKGGLKVVEKGTEAVVTEAIRQNKAKIVQGVRDALNSIAPDRGPSTAEAIQALADALKAGNP